MNGDSECQAIDAKTNSLVDQGFSNCFGFRGNLTKVQKSTMLKAFMSRKAEILSKRQQILNLIDERQRAGQPVGY
jgi:hypothetical protein